MRSLQKMGGVSAFVMAGTFVFGMTVFFTFLVSANYGARDVDPAAHVAFLVQNQAILFVWYLSIYVVFGAFLVVLSLALHERLKAGSPAMAQTAAAFGLIWAGLMFASGMVANVGSSAVVEFYGRDIGQAVSTWVALDLVVTGLGGGNEIVGGLWVSLVSWAALRGQGLPKALCYLGLVAGLAGIVQTAVPALEVLGAVFGLGLIVWFAWGGVVMLQGTGSAAMQQPALTNKQHNSTSSVNRGFR